MALFAHHSYPAREPCELRVTCTVAVRSLLRHLNHLFPLGLTRVLGDHLTIVLPLQGR